jgi:hypothetical protein
MIPLLMRIHIVEGHKKKAGLIILLFLVWLLLLPFVIVLTPLMLLAGLILWPSGYGKMILKAGNACPRQDQYRRGGAAAFCPL